MSNLISGKEALIALANGEEVEFFYRDVWDSIGEMIVIDHFMSGKFKFRLKPRTITLNGVEVPAPFDEPKDEDDCRCYCINTSHKNGYDWYHCSHHSAGRIVWRTEEEIKQVVEALRSIFK